ncbi:hypothetical protein PAXINDRAFT_172607 [Paxillus involutus ATCC 200175]|uniref:Uncharacterized protein n=1 Tax=Paxillus involutus ATCC 200175 TaxID=664439 RepID=A0A0C9TMX6_PAXIN|nr:hypothetical protein PAXINDRAFT_172607 [Paxillus involutus ATCC 200175]
MVNWKDPEVEARLVGLYGWEYFRSFQVEWALIRFRLSFRWPLVSMPHFTATTFTEDKHLGGDSLCGRSTKLIGLGDYDHRYHGSNVQGHRLRSCNEIYISEGNIAVGCASTNLMIRTWLIWRDSRFVLCLLSLVSVVHWTILIIALTSIDAYMTSGGCEVMYVDTPKALTVYLYTMFYDMLVLVLTTIGLSRKRSSCTLWRRLYRQGIAYFAVTFLANIMPRLSVGSILMLSCPCFLPYPQPV